MIWELDAVSVRFGDVLAVDSASFEISSGELVVILGPSGCGKSTMLRVVAGLQQPDSGRVLIDGADSAALLPHQRSIGLMFQQHTLFPHHDVAGNVEFGLRMAGLAPAQRAQRVRDLLVLVGLGGFESRDVATLSGGEAQRVALARSLAPNPALLLLDEPFGSLDRGLRDRLTDELPQVLSEAGTTAIHVTHDHDEAFSLADRLVVMESGRILRVGPPGEVWADPRTVAVAEFLGHRNIVTRGSRLEVIRRDAATVAADGELEGIVVTSRFRGDYYDLTVDTALGELRFRVGEAVGAGDRVRLRIDPSRVARLNPRPAS
ncbi:MAG: ABC transporter ATP-binding protein [Acidimicrobiaceae bacterium]|nr:ABC transporter ATP-binding protein [Acidimicrobiaceae bacterium]MYA74619.1 ABC transporter ATP-binding protein [Acidimicrobiaceae bacterium]MYD07071.1 ABC transporter ATP-binding protein [Acidimicrobiaceae bacterium]MYG54769.1 ABC transporter ATP-binding protein [Acidimicrobiaceae bacterium]MYI59098.1 ABC transporter ATP-binding protein [Acidimicrobiaceae bacterium]